MRADLASRSRQGTLVITEKSDHNIPGGQAAIVTEETRRVVAIVRGK